MCTELMDIIIIDPSCANNEQIAEYNSLRHKIGDRLNSVSIQEKLAGLLERAGSILNISKEQQPSRALEFMPLKKLTRLLIKAASTSSKLG
jgi:hypothetical protein